MSTVGWRWSCAPSMHEYGGQLNNSTRDDESRTLVISHERCELVHTLRYVGLNRLVGRIGMELMLLVGYSRTGCGSLEPRNGVGTPLLKSY